MSHEITLDEARERAVQAELVLRLLESHPHQLSDCEVSDIATLCRRLIGNAAGWLIEEQAQREGN